MNNALLLLFRLSTVIKCVVQKMTHCQHLQLTPVEHHVPKPQNIFVGEPTIMAGCRTSSRARTPQVSDLSLGVCPAELRRQGGEEGMASASTAAFGLRHVIEANFPVYKDETGTELLFHICCQRMSKQSRIHFAASLTQPEQPQLISLFMEGLKWEDKVFLN